MNPDGSVESWCVGRCPDFIEPNMETEVERHFEHFHRLDLRKYQACVLCSCCHQRILARPWDPVAVEPSDCPSMFQDLAEPETLEAEAAPVSWAATRAARLPTICSRNFRLWKRFARMVAFVQVRLFH